MYTFHEYSQEVMTNHKNLDYNKLKGLMRFSFTVSVAFYNQDSKNCTLVFLRINKQYR